MLAPPGQRLGVQVDPPGPILRVLLHPAAGEQSRPAEVLAQQPRRSPITSEEDAADEVDVGVRVLDALLVQGVAVGPTGLGVASGRAAFALGPSAHGRRYFRCGGVDCRSQRGEADTRASAPRPQPQPIPATTVRRSMALPPYAAPAVGVPRPGVSRRVGWTPQPTRASGSRALAVSCDRVLPVRPSRTGGVVGPGARSIHSARRGSSGEGSPFRTPPPPTNSKLSDTVDFGFVAVFTCDVPTLNATTPSGVQEKIYVIGNKKSHGGSPSVTMRQRARGSPLVTGSIRPLPMGNSAPGQASGS